MDDVCCECGYRRGDEDDVVDDVEVEVDDDVDVEGDDDVDVADSVRERLLGDVTV